MLRLLLVLPLLAPVLSACGAKISASSGERQMGAALDHYPRLGVTIHEG
jgi:hypothetical protein